ncbi:MAG: nitrous oxide reductase accessory protein NosL [Saprospiraceae bacterium]|nr:nitrous oxide reductase accessory protein NosL [Saprospiraceae bacterium]
MYKISTLSRTLLALGAVLLLVMLKVPIWNIYLTAPQYPEGLEMKIWHNTLTGDVKIISALNHYIGMRPISVEMFPEFQYLGTVILAVAALCLALALLGRWWSALAYYLVLAVADSLALFDFWRWGYDYGHNLNPEAPIVIPGMAYQPPVIGYKQLLNFEAWSLPDTGGWVLMAVTLLSFGVVVVEWRKHRQKHRAAAMAGAGRPLAKVAGLLLLPLLCWHCSAGPRPIAFGSDACAHCKMTLMDKRFGAEITTKKGKVYVLDDVNCCVKFLSAGSLEPADVAGIYVVDYRHEGVLLDATQAVFLRNPGLNTPMASGLVAFASPSDAQPVRAIAGGDLLDWAAVQDLF